MPPAHKALWKVPPAWKGEIAFVIAGGTSIDERIVSQIRGKGRVVVINSSYAIAPWADLLFFGDSRWWLEHAQKRIGDLPPVLDIFEGSIATCSPAAIDFNRNLLRLKRIPISFGLAKESTQVVMRRTSLCPLLNILYHKRISYVYLLGADAKRSDDGREYHHYPHQWKGAKNKYAEQMADLKRMIKPLRRAGMSIFNCSPISAIDWWPKVDVRSILHAYPVETQGH